MYQKSARLYEKFQGQQRPGVNRLLLHLGVVLFAISMVSASLLAFNESSLPEPWLWISPAILCVACIGTALLLSRADIQIVASPVFWVLLASGVYWGFGPLIYTFGDRNTIAHMSAGYFVDPWELHRTNLLNSVGMLALVIGLAIGRRAVRQQQLGWVRRYADLDALRIAGVMAAIGLTVKLVLVLPSLFGLIGTQSSTLLKVQVLSKGALIILAYFSATRGGKSTVLFILLFIADFLTASFFGNKNAFLRVIIATLVGRTLAVQKPSTVVKGLMTLGLLLLVLSPVVGQYRLVRHGLTERNYVSSMATTGALMAQSFSDLIHGRNVARETRPLGWWSRLCYAPQQAFAMHEYDSGRPGRFVEDVAMGLIPRVLWRDKPLIAPGVRFSILFDGNPHNNNAPGVFGEGYWYGGWVGLLAVGIYAGIYLGGVDRVSRAIISRRAWIFMPLVFIGIEDGFRIDGWFSLEFVFGSIWYVLFAVGMVGFSKLYPVVTGQRQFHATQDQTLRTNPKHAAQMSQPQRESRLHVKSREVSSPEVQTMV